MTEDIAQDDIKILVGSEVSIATEELAVVDDGSSEIARLRELNIAKGSSFDFAKREDLGVLSFYERYPCPAELMVPFRMPGPKRSVLRAYIESRFNGPLWNMDFPWIVTMGAALAGCITFAIITTILERIGWGTMMFGAAIIAGFPLFFALMSPLVYPILVSSNMKAGYGDDWTRTILTPTHISITDSGFKLYFRGQWFYNYPNLAIWPEVFEVDLNHDELYNTIALRFIYQSGFGRMAIRLPLIGFESEEDMLIVLDHFHRFVPEDHQGEAFKTLAAEKFEPVLRALREKSFEGLKSETTFGDRVRIALNLGAGVEPRDELSQEEVAKLLGE